MSSVQVLTNFESPSLNGCSNHDCKNNGICSNCLLTNLSNHFKLWTFDPLCRPSERPVLRNGWSASTLLAGVHALDLQVIKRELPDSLEDLEKLYDANCPI